METKNCPFCIEEIKIDAIKCKHCGELLISEDFSKSYDESMWICKTCKKGVDQNYEICWNCGTNKDGILDKETEKEFKELKQNPSKLDFSGGHIIRSILVFSVIGFSTGYFMFGRFFGRFIPIGKIFSTSSEGLEGLIGGILIEPIRQNIIFTTITGVIIGAIIGRITDPKKTKE